MESAALNKAGRNATVTSVIVCGAFVICWSSGQIMYFLTIIGSRPKTPNWFYHFTSAIVPLAEFIIFDNFITV